MKFALSVNRALILENDAKPWNNQCKIIHYCKGLKTIAILK